VLNYTLFCQQTHQTRCTWLSGQFPLIIAQLPNIRSELALCACELFVPSLMTL